jgi:stringent starvation protein B
MDDHPGKPATKKELLERMLERGMAMIHLDARRADVDVPLQYRSDPQLRLNLSYRFQGGDLHVDGDGVRATLSFSGIPHTCVVPFDAVFAMVSHITGESFFFPTDAPPEALAGLAAIVGPLDEEGDASKKGSTESPTDAMSSASQRLAGGRPALRAIDGGAGTEPDPSRNEDDDGDDDDGLDARDDASSAQAEDSASDEVAETSSAPRRRGHLRLVK